MADVEERIENVVARAFRGVHHCSGWPRRKRLSHGGVSFVVDRMLSTYDYDDLTRLVLAAHEECIRVEIDGAAPGYMRVYLSPRVRPGVACDSQRPTTMETHPTIEYAIKKFREGRRG